MSKNTKLIAILFMILSAFSFALMSVMVKLLPDFPVIEKAMARNLISLIVSFYLLKKMKLNYFSSKKNIKFLIYRAIFGIGGIMLFFYSIDHLYLADASLLNKLSPFFVTFFAWIFLKEKPRKIQILALFIVFLASLLIIKPKFDLSIIPALIGFISAIFAGIAYTFVRYLNDKESPQSIVFFFSLLSTIVLLPFCFFNFRIPSLLEVLYLFLIGIFATGGQYGLTYAYKLSKANEVSIFTYTNVIFAALFGFFIFFEVPDIYSTIGGIVIILVSVISYLIHKKENG